MALTPKQRKFADFYMQTGNASEAARMAGYKGKNINDIGYQNLKKDSIAAYIHEQQKDVHEERVADMLEIKAFWTKTMRNPKEVQKERLKASELLAKSAGAFLEKTEANVNHDIKLTVEWGTPDNGEVLP